MRGNQSINVSVYEATFVGQGQLPTVQLPGYSLFPAGEEHPSKPHLLFHSAPPLPQPYHVPHHLSSLTDTIRHGSKWLNSTFPAPRKIRKISGKLCKSPAFVNPCPSRGQHSLGWGAQYFPMNFTFSLPLETDKKEISRLEKKNSEVRITWDAYQIIPWLSFTVNKNQAIFWYGSLVLL